MNEGIRSDTDVTGTAVAPSASILFLDDEEAILASLRSLFRTEGYTVTLFREGREALAFLRENTVDVIICDMRMPEMSGLEFLNAASAICPEATRVMLSGFEDKGVVIEAIARGLAHHYLLKPWDDRSFKSLLRESIGFQRELRKQQLKKLLSSFASLPESPRFHVRLQGMLSDDNNSLSEIVREIEKSPALVAKLLRVANSVYYGTRKAVTSVRDAVVFIGTDYITSLVMAIEAFHSITKGAGAEITYLIEALWDKALRRASVSKAIGEQWPGFKDRNLPYVASLLQDIGYVVRVCSEPHSYRRMMELSVTRHSSRYDADVRVFVIPHDEVGAALLQLWNFPTPLVNAVASHHGRAGEDILTQIVQIAEALECDGEEPYDPAIKPLIREWHDKLRL